MDKGNIGTDILETLGGIVKGTGKQAVIQAKKAGEDVAESLGIKPLSLQSSPDTNQTTCNQKELQKLAQEDKIKAARYKKILEEIKEIQHRRRQEEEAYKVGPSGQKAETTMVKQLEVVQQPKAKINEEKSQTDKNKLPPLPVQIASRKTEIHRGVSG